MSSEFEWVHNAFDVSRETYDRLKQYQQLLVKWQARINLIGPDTVADAWQRHFIDSLQLLPMISDRSARIVDMGSGAGFPGMVLAVAGCGDVHIIESDAKKITFLREVARVTSTKVSIHHARMENVMLDDVRIITSRACASLNQLFEYAERYVSRETLCYFHKGKNYNKELLDSQLEWLFDYSVIPSITDALGSVLRIANLRKRPNQ